MSIYGEPFPLAIYLFLYASKVNSETFCRIRSNSCLTYGNHNTLEGSCGILNQNQNLLFCWNVCDIIM